MIVWDYVNLNIDDYSVIHQARMTQLTLLGVGFLLSGHMIILFKISFAAVEKNVHLTINMVNWNIIMSITYKVEKHYEYLDTNHTSIY